MISSEIVICVSLQDLRRLPPSKLFIHRVLWVFNDNLSEMLPQFIEEPLSSVEAWQLPVDVDSDITAGECGGALEST